MWWVIQVLVEQQEINKGRAYYILKFFLQNPLMIALQKSFPASLSQYTAVRDLKVYSAMFSLDLDGFISFLWF